jgi:hypothetical protein
MEREIRDNDYVIIICTPKFKTKSDDRAGGVGYEGDIMTAEVSTKRNHRKFIPVFARGRWVDSAPSWLIGKYYLDLIDVSRYEEGYKKLLATILGKLSQAPLMGSLSDAERLAATIVESMEDSDREANAARAFLPPRCRRSNGQCSLSPPANWSTSIATGGKFTQKSENWESCWHVGKRVARIEGNVRNESPGAYWFGPAELRRCNIPIIQPLHSSLQQSLAQVRVVDLP